MDGLRLPLHIGLQRERGVAGIQAEFIAGAIERQRLAGAVLQPDADPRGQAAGIQRQQAGQFGVLGAGKRNGHRIAQAEIAFSQVQREGLAVGAGVQVQVFVDDGAEIQLDVLIPRLYDTRLGHQRTVKAHVFRRSRRLRALPHSPISRIHRLKPEEGGETMVSVFDIFKIGIGPSSSHTVGPMKAGKQFVDDLIAHQQLQDTTRVVVDVYGSLSLTGKGHHTDIAIIMGLAGNLPHDVDIDSIPGFIRDVEQRGRLPLANGHHEVDFPLHGGMNFHSDNLPLHENGMRIRAFAGERLLHSKTYYSIGGGFIVDEEHFGQSAEGATPVPYPFKSAHDLQQHCKDTGLSLSGLVMQNELALRSKADIDAHFADVWQVMSAGIERGINTEGLLPGPMKVPRRAAALRRILVTGDKNNIDPMNVVDWINMFALAVNEENAAGGRVVTAPTNGACGIIPAVLAYYDKFIRPVNANSYTRYFLASGVIGALYKMNASISGAEVGCQGEVGVACSMAAAGLTELLGGSPAQVCIAAEIAMEHHLGLTCDPLAGQVQVPCIERNAISAVKAVNAARMAMRRTSEPRVCLDKVIETMYETGKDMNAKYRETSQGGLAIKVVACN